MSGSPESAAALLDTPAAPPAGVVRRFGVFVRGGYQFAMPIDCVREVIPGQALTRAPRVHPVVAGLLNFRGDILAVLLVDAWLNTPARPYDVTKPILVLRQEAMLFGIQVDSVQGVQEIPEGEIETDPPGAARSLQARQLGYWQPPNQPVFTLLAEDAFVHLARALETPAES